MKVITHLFAMFSLVVGSFSSLSSCFWFAHEPELPKDLKDKDE